LSNNSGKFYFAPREWDKVSVSMDMLSGVVSQNISEIAFKSWPSCNALQWKEAEKL